MPEPVGPDESPADDEREPVTDHGSASHGRGVDLSAALHTAGHETELLHAEDVPDTGKAIDGLHAADRDFDLESAAGYGLRGMDADLANVDDERGLPD